MEGLAGGHVTQLHSTARHRLHPGASRSESGDPQGRGIQPLPLSSLRRAGSLCQPPFSHWYQLWSLGLMFVGQKGCSRARVGSVGKREDLKTPLGAQTQVLAVPTWEFRCGHCPLFLPEGFPGLWVPGRRVKPSPTEVGTVV